MENARGREANRFWHIARRAVDSRIKSNDRSRVSEIISDNSYAIGEQCHDCLTAAIQSAGSTYMGRTGWAWGFSLGWDFAWSISIGGRGTLECGMDARYTRYHGSQDCHTGLLRVPIVFPQCAIYWSEDIALPVPVSSRAAESVDKSVLIKQICSLKIYNWNIIFRKLWNESSSVMIKSYTNNG